MGLISFEKRILENGLVVIHHEDKSTPFVVLNLLYKAGAKDEHPDKTGFAHLFEHLMFEGTKNVPSFDEPLQEAGGENNAYTTNDYTNYYDVLPAINAELAFALEADRMRSLNINKKSLALQQKVVVEEFKETCINQPYGDVWHILREMVYQQHPYRWPVIGKTPEHVRNATLDDVRNFYDRYYIPSNAILATGGNISAQQAFEWAEKWFGKLDGHHPEYIKQTEPEQTVQNIKTVQGSVPEDMIYIAWPMPDRLHPDYYTADVITDILSTGASSRLHQRLEKEQKILIQTDAYISGSNEIGMLIVEGRLSKNIPPEDAAEALFKEMELLAQESVSDEELRKVKNKMLTYMHFSDASLLNRVGSLAYYEMLGDAQLINEEEEMYENVSATAIQKYAEKYLCKEKSNVLFYLSKNGQQ